MKLLNKYNELKFNYKLLENYIYKKDLNYYLNQQTLRYNILYWYCGEYIQMKNAYLVNITDIWHTIYTGYVVLNNLKFRLGMNNVKNPESLQYRFRFETRLLPCTPRDSPLFGLVLNYNTYANSPDSVNQTWLFYE